jgi:hypothetical protein
MKVSNLAINSIFSLANDRGSDNKQVNESEPRALAGEMYFHALPACF